MEFGGALTDYANQPPSGIGDEIELLITDDGNGGTSAARSSGHGLTGMRERVAFYGGKFRAGPRSGGGFEVYALLPREAK